MAERQAERQRKTNQRRTSAGHFTEATSDGATLTLERIVATAIDMMDADGVDGLKMRRLAERLGSGAMSLYWHVANKEHVYDLALDSVLGFQEPRQNDQNQTWREEILLLLDDWRTIMIRHPWSATLLPRQALGPSILCRLEMLGTSLSKGGVSDAQLNVAIWSLWNYVMGATVTRTNFSRSEEDNAAAQDALLQMDERYPTICRSRLLANSDWEGTFKDGLNLLLDGIETRK